MNAKYEKESWENATCDSFLYKPACLQKNFHGNYCTIGRALWPHSVSSLMSTPDQFKPIRIEWNLVVISNRQLLDEVFVISRIIKVEVGVISQISQKAEADNPY